jgi:DNA-directed RNA polymerase specialized sigma24 family protein
VDAARLRKPGVSLDDGFGPEAPRDAIIDPGPGVESTAFVSGVPGRAVEVIQGLADTDRMVIVLKYYHGLKLAQVAEALGLEHAEDPASPAPWPAPSCRQTACRAGHLPGRS